MKEPPGLSERLEEPSGLVTPFAESQVVGKPLCLGLSVGQIGPKLSANLLLDSVAVACLSTGSVVSVPRPSLQG